ncbi:MAG TPA: hypothetical protein VK348_09890 [Planctomycetota bacterium]|nr:hypothetical protein [Planctomycetota bacterium]
MRSTLLPFVLVATATAAFAQAPAHLVGLTAQIPVLLHRDQSTCNNVSCTPPGFPQTLALPNAGGTGWDPVLSGAWISNGPVLACVDDNCNYLCPPGPSPVPPGALITGLEVVESLNEIWATDSLSNLVRISRACPPAMLSSCNTGVPFTPTRGTSGLAVDEGLQLVFIAAADWVSGASQLRISTMASPCTPFQALPITGGSCGVVLRPITGLAVDWWHRVLYLTDGFTTLGWSYAYTPSPPAVTFTPLNCCPNGFGDSLVGLAWRPEKAVPFGPTCANGTCPTCAMQHRLANDPNLGNSGFALNLTGASAGSLDWAVLTIGSCAGPGFTIAGVCGPLFVTAATLGTLGPVTATGGIGCAANAQFLLPIPLAPALAGLPIASQCFAWCPAGTGGTSLSNCLSWVLQGN